MANDTIVTIQGWIANEPVARDVAGATVLNFRVGCTPRHYRKASNSWTDGMTQWYSVSAWRRLAENGARSLQRGDAVVVHGRLSHRTYVNSNGIETLAIEIEALSIGHDLTRGMSRFTKAEAAGDHATEPVPQAEQVPPPPEQYESAPAA